MSEAAGQPGREPERFDVVVVGAGIAGLVSAYDLARRGYRVLVLEATDRVGGVVGRLTLPELPELPLDRGAESFATRGATVEALLQDVGLGDSIVRPAEHGAWLQLAGKAVPLPKNALLGIPASPLARDVIDAIGWRGAIRAYLDRITPVIKIGKYRELATLVERRMGSAVLERLVTPIAGGVYSADPALLDVSIVAPGLNEAITRAGSLSGGVAFLLEERAQGGSQPGGAVQGIDGGMHRLVTALVREAERFHAEIRNNAAVTGLRRTAEGWTVETGDARIAASAVVVASDAGSAIGLLVGIDGFDELAELPAPQETAVELVTLVFDGDALRDDPRGSGVLVARDAAAISAKAATHSTAKWPWLREVADGREVVRLSYGSAGSPPATEGLSDGEAVRLAKRDAEAIFATELPHPIAAARVRLEQAQPAATQDARARQQAARAAVAAHSTLELVGAWIAGTGLAQVVPHAREAVMRIRREDFIVSGSPWGSDDGERG